MPAASASPPRRLAAQPCRRPSPPRRKWTASRGNPCARRSGSGARRAPRSSAATAARWSSRRCPSSKVPRRNPPRGPASSPRPPVPSLRPLCPVPVSSPPLPPSPLCRGGSSLLPSGGLRRGAWCPWHHVPGLPRASPALFWGLVFAPPGFEERGGISKAWVKEKKTPWHENRHRSLYPSS